ncbi:metallophosphoesterase family protein [Salinisphaera sp.]|uniref:metallophosphoesterase family protein n=1 Tax=Salinisphaera sp. TaxID=1914330 RepID=UPI002D781DF0|nr:metallophosphoesterase family protein [Salinisphaera sp.]HET7315775.1 metallophosphoesterase family protein [Salinisphaera sp.]
MRVVILADTHGFLDPRIAECATGAALIVHAGDVGETVVDALAGRADELLIVAGNNDPDDSPWPQSASRDLPGGRLAVMHGHQWPSRTRHRRLRAEFPHARAIVCGHSHRRVLETEAAPWLLNPGAAGKSRAYGGPGYIELRIVDDGWRVEPVIFEPLAGKLRRR